MIPGLQLLAISSAAGAASQAGGVMRDAVHSFAGVLTNLSEPAEPTAATDEASVPEQEQLRKIHESVQRHLKQLGLPALESLQIEVHTNGKLTVHSDAANRNEIEDAIEQDTELVGMLQQLARQRTGFAQPHFVHYPPTESA